MSGDKLPVFDEAYAKKKVRPYNTFGGKVVDLYYGAVDADNNPILPNEDAEDGHGHWNGIEVDGDYTMFFWKKPASEGGEVVYGTEYKENALQALIDTLNKKQDLCRQLEVAVRSNDPEVETKAEAAKAAWDELKDWGTPKDAELSERFTKAMSEYSTRKEEFERNFADKQSIIEEAKKLVDSTNWRDTQRAFRSLREEMDSIRSAGAEADASFRKTLHELQQSFFEKKDAYFANLDTIHAEAKAKKEALIEEQKELLGNVTNWKKAGDKIAEIFAEWKKAGSAGRDVDDELWEKFNETRKEFFAKRQAFFEERNELWKKVAEVKTELIADLMKDLDKQWKAAGTSGRESDDKLWEEFSQAKEVFWDAKKEEAVKGFKARLERFETQASELKKEIDDLAFKVEISPKLEIKQELDREIDKKKQQLERLEEDTENLKSKIDN